MRKRITLIMIPISFAIALIALPFAVQPAAAQTSSLWSVEYYNSTNLRGNVAYADQVNSVGFDWTASAPVPGVNANFFSARWTSVKTLDAGSYQVQVQADDGVRVLVDNTPIINEYHTSANRTFSETFDLSAGQHVFEVQYYEGGGVAYLDFDLNQVSQNPDQAIAVVQAFRLNVREEPSVLTGDVITQVTQNEAYPIIGRTADGLWWRIQANGVTGWVSNGWINVFNAENVPITEDETPELTGYALTAAANLNIRSGPGVSNGIVGWLPFQQSAQIIGRNANNTWWQIRYNDVTGWVSDVYSQLEVGVTIGDIPVTEGIITTDTLTANVNLNIRSGPGVEYAVAGWLPYQQSAQVIGRNADSSWWQIRYQDVTGWVSSFYTTLDAGTNVNTIPVTG